MIAELRYNIPSYYIWSDHINAYIDGPIYDLYAAIDRAKMEASKPFHHQRRARVMQFDTNRPNTPGRQIYATDSQAATPC